MNDRDSFAERYAAMPEVELERLSLDVESLVPEAREALRLELERRNIPAESIDWTAQPVIQAAPADGSGFRRFTRNLGIFAACDLGYLIAAILVVANVNGVDSKAFAGSLTDSLLHLSFGLAVVTANPILIPKRFVPQTTKTLFIVGAASPPIAFLPIGIVGHFHLGDAVGSMFWPAVVIWLIYGLWRNKRKNPVGSPPNPEDTKAGAPS
jgi:hypothetical protein